MVRDAVQLKPISAELSGEIEKVRQNIWRTILRGFEIVTSAVPFLCVIATVVAQVLNTWHNPWQDPISSLVWGSYGAIQTAAFYLLGFAVLILAFKLLPRSKSWLLRAGIAALALTGLGMVLVGVFPAGRDGFPRTITDILHTQISTVIMLLFPAACFIMAPRIKDCFSRNWLSAYTWAAGALGIILVFLQAALVLPGHGWMGTIERFQVLNGIAWVQVVTFMTLKKTPACR